MIRVNIGQTAAATVALGIAVSLAGIDATYGHGASHNPTRHQYLQTEGIPEAYGELLNPLRATGEQLATGGMLYEENCAACHGVVGAGDGDAAEGLEPPPAALNVMYTDPMESAGAGGADTHLMHGVAHHHPGQTHAEAMGGLNLDAYMYWVTSEGGEAFGSSMPGFADILSEDERWQILLYVANGFSTEQR